jgi:3-isopropylmalate dehydrogenase
VTTYSIACLAGDGIGPEVMAQASRGLREASRLHGFRVDERHVPFGADATMRFGNPFPLASRDAALAADAVLAATVEPSLLRTLESELDLRVVVMRVRRRSAAITFVAPLGTDSWDWALDRAAVSALSSRGRLTLVGSEAGWEGEAETAVARNEGLELERLSTRRAIRGLLSHPEEFDVVVCARPLLVALAELPWCLDAHRVLAWGRAAAAGPGIYGPSHGTAVDIAGQGVADPSSMLLAAALMLEGLGERGAAATLSSAVSHALGNGAQRAVGTVSMTTELTDAVLAQLPQSHSNAEFLREAV